MDDVTKQCDSTLNSFTCLVKRNVNSPRKDHYKNSIGYLSNPIKSYVYLYYENIQHTITA